MLILMISICTKIILLSAVNTIFILFRIVITIIHLFSFIFLLLLFVEIRQSQQETQFIWVVVSTTLNNACCAWSLLRSWYSECLFIRLLII